MAAMEPTVWARPVYRPRGEPTRRGWLVLGENGGACDQHCQMCYFAHQKQRRFYTLETMIGMANRQRHYYGLNATDISGGEPTVYPDIRALVQHCAHIGLEPTIITHGQNSTPDMVDGIEAAGLEYWKVSLHGLQTGHNAAVQRDDAWQRLVGNLRNYHRPVHFNTTVLKDNAAELPALARFLIDAQPPTVWNLITFNPFWDWQGQEHIEFQVQYTTAAPYYAEAITLAQRAGWEVNARYFPPCVAAQQGFEANCIDFYGTQWDPWEWDLLATNRAPMPVRGGLGEYSAAVVLARRELCDQIARSRANERCDTCRFHPICEGPTEQYQRQYGLDELRPATGDPVHDILYFERGGKFDD
jgi:pyruvate-formate lyase-activating enzyme